MITRTPPSAISKPSPSGAPISKLASMRLTIGGYRWLKSRSDGRFALVQLAAGQAPICPAKDRQKKLPSGFAAGAAHAGDRDPPMLKGTA